MNAPPPIEIDPDKALTIVGGSAGAVAILRWIWQWAKVRIIAPPINEALREALKKDLETVESAAGEVRRLADEIQRLVLDLRQSRADLKAMRRIVDEHSGRLDEINGMLDVVIKLVARPEPE